MFDRVTPLFLVLMKKTSSQNVEISKNIDKILPEYKKSFYLYILLTCIKILALKINLFTYIFNDLRIIIEDAINGIGQSTKCSCFHDWRKMFEKCIYLFLNDTATYSGSFHPQPDFSKFHRNQESGFSPVGGTGYYKL